MMIWSTLTVLLLGLLKITIVAALFLSISSIINGRFTLDGSLTYGEKLILKSNKQIFLETILSLFLMTILSLVLSPSAEEIFKYSFIYVFILLFILLKNPFEVLYWAFILTTTVFLMEYTSIDKLYKNITFLGNINSNLAIEMIIYKMLTFILMSIMLVNRAERFIHKTGILNLTSLSIFFVVYVSIFFSSFVSLKYNVTDQLLSVLYKEIVSFTPFILKSIAIIFVVSLFAHIRKKPHAIVFEL